MSLTHITQEEIVSRSDQARELATVRAETPAQLASLRVADLGYPRFLHDFQVEAFRKAFPHYEAATRYKLDEFPSRQRKHISNRRVTLFEFEALRGMMTALGLGDRYFRRLDPTVGVVLLTPPRPALRTVQGCFRRESPDGSTFCFVAGDRVRIRYIFCELYDGVLVEGHYGVLLFKPDFPGDFSPLWNLDRVASIHFLDVDLSTVHV